MSVKVKVKPKKFQDYTVLLLFQECFKDGFANVIGDSWVLKGVSKGVSRVFCGCCVCFKGVSLVFQGDFMGVSRFLQGRSRV